MRRRPGSWFSDKQTLRDPALGEVWPPSPIPVHRSRLGVAGCSKSLSELFSQATPGTGSRTGSAPGPPRDPGTLRSWPGLPLRPHMGSEARVHSLTLSYFIHESN